ncbi:hypothetical protein [Phenylobacterium sp.]|nr:hypothetical protein [Phenylobacterium sp.]
MPELIRHVIDLVEMRPMTTAAVAAAVVLYIRFMTRGPYTR